MSELVVVAEWTIAPGNEEVVMELLSQIEEVTRTERGCISFEGFVSRSDPRKVTLLERYADLQAFMQHRSSEHFHRIVQERIAPLLNERTVAAHVPVPL